MRILHYSLGLPPYRSGGLTKYCTDLMVEQAKSNDEIFLLFPGRMNFIKKDNVKIKFYKNYKNVKVYELINPLPVPILNGICDPKLFTKVCDKSVFKNFLKNMKIDIVHIHTFMGLYKEFLEVCKELDIKLVFTSHDYFGLCSKVNFIDNQGILCENLDFEKCARCNASGDSIKKIKILQSQTYRYIKDKGMIDKFKKYIKKNKHLSRENTECINIRNKENEYAKLSKYYYSMFQHIDKIHFNSEVSKSVYNYHINIDGVVVPITHGSILDNRKYKKYKENLNFGYLGPITEAKGFYLLKKVCDELYNAHKDNFKLHIFANYNGEEEYIEKHTPYKYHELEKVMESIDILIVPSLWNETFGFTTLEALSYGVPVIVSKYVGAKDILENGKSGLVYEDSKELKDMLENIIINKKTKLPKMNKYIMDSVKVKEISEHVKEIEALYLI